MNLCAESDKSHRVWEIGSGIMPEIDGYSITLSVLPDMHDNFASLISIFNALSKRVSRRDAAAFEDIRAFLVDTGQTPDDSGVTAHWRIMSDNVAHAIMRRISRESVYTARVIDSAAKALNDTLAKLDIQSVIVPDVDRLDRLTLKVLARAMLLLPASARLIWIWRSDSDPTDHFAAYKDPYLRSRQRLLNTLVGVVQPKLRVVGAPSALRRPDVVAGSDISKISVALVLQNYDACLLWCPALFGSEADGVEARRLFGIALVNISEPKDACDIWQDALRMTASASMASHIHYLRGLVKSKRAYDLDASNAEFARGMALLQNAQRTDGDDPALETAWLYNGLALNQAITWRKNKEHGTAFATAFDHLQKAFTLIEGEADSARNYLRFNLLANMAFLMEMAGRYGEAINVFEKVFKGVELAGSEQMTRLRGTLNYRLGILNWKKGNTAQAQALLTSALAAETEFGLSTMRDHILRGQGAILLSEERPKEAIAKYEEGLELAAAERSAEGWREHARGLVHATVATGDVLSAERIRKRLEAEEAVSLAQDHQTDGCAVRDIRPRPPSPKLPAYIPEIDLEGIPAVNLNRFLSDRAPSAPVAEAH